MPKVRGKKAVVKKAEVKPEWYDEELERIAKEYTPRTHWEDWEEEMLRRYFGRVPTAELVKKLKGRTVQGVLRKASNLGISYDR